MNTRKLVNILYAYRQDEQDNREELVAFCKYLRDIKTPYFENVSDDEIETVVDAYQYYYGGKTYIPPETLVQDKTKTKWLYDKKSQVSHDFENRFRKFLLLHEHFAENTINYIVDESEKILSLCANPETQDKMKGLVIGDVQSGKTTNYLALINMACDYGYKLILLLTGISESLRIQTQERVEEGFTGKASSEIKDKAWANQIVGVGTINETGNEGGFAISLTTRHDDFNSSSYNFSSDEFNKPVIIVAKKNSKILESVRDWLKQGYSKSLKSILIIDDECDNASVNTKKSDEQPTKINGLIRDIYNDFPCASYVGYTATPYANIFINPFVENQKYDDLFPKDFIIRLKTSEDGPYFGKEKVFAKNSKHIVLISDDEINKLPAKHKKDAEIPILWDSLKNAICMFLICNVIRTLRGDEDQNRTMMINATPYNKVQSELYDLVSDYVEKLQKIIPQYDRYSMERFLKNDEMKRIYNLYAKEDIFNTPDLYYANTGDSNKTIRENIKFDEIKVHLFEEIDRFKVFVVRNKTNNNDEKLNYDEYKNTGHGARFIVIGGYILSRGLTLKGLMTSYYSRNSTTYDTLLQMCRWFGYRDGYEDLCTIYMSQESVDCFGAVIDAINDLDEQLHYMSARGEKPEQFGLMIKESPDTLETDLFITSANKRRNTAVKEVGLNYSGKTINTSKLYDVTEKNTYNQKSVDDLIKILINNGYKLTKDRRLMFKDVEPKYIADFIIKFKKTIPYQNKKFDAEALASFISDANYFKKRDVVFPSGDGKETFKLDETYAVQTSQRSFSYDNDYHIIKISKSNNQLLDPNVFNAGLTEAQLNMAKESARKRSKEKGNYVDESSLSLTISDYMSIEGRNPVLVIVPIELIQDNENDEKSDFSINKIPIIERYKNGNPLIGLGIGFPKKEQAVIVKYRMNKVKIKEFELMKEEEEDVIDDE